MKKLTIVVMVLVCVVSVSAFAKGKAMKSSTKVTSGDIVSVDAAAKSFVLKSGGKDTTVYWTDKTKVSGGEVKANEHATVHWMMKDGKAWATSVKISAGSAKKAA